MYYLTLNLHIEVIKKMRMINAIKQNQPVNQNILGAVKNNPSLLY